MLWLLAHAFWIFRTEVNWDEFALLARAHDSLVQGRLIGGSRPGLATVLLMPIVEGCTNTVDAVLRARVLWLPFAAAIPAGLWYVLASLFRDRDSRYRDALWGVALLLLTPAFLRHSLQVRTDEPAIAFALLGGVALLASRDRVPMAALAGLLFGLGYTSSQKAVYVAALMGLLAIAESLRSDRFRWRRDLLRVGAVVVAGLCTLGLYRGLVSLFIEPAPPTNIEGQLSWFAYYRDRVGYGFYLEMLPQLVVPVGLMLLVLLRVPAALVRRPGGRSAALTAAAVAVLGLIVAAFHAGAFPYFWMTLGLFPAVIVAVGLPLLRDWLPPERRKWIFAAAAGLLVATVLVMDRSDAREVLHAQQDAMDLVTDNFNLSQEGFSTKRALFCRDGADPFRTYFGPTLHSWEEARIESFIREFRSRPVVYMIASRDMAAFPDRVREFWNAHYVAYRGALLVAGVELADMDGGGTRFEVIVPGEYVLRAEDPDARISVDGREVTSGEGLRLDPGVYRIRADQGGKSAIFALSLPSPPGATAERFFLGH